MHMSPPCKLHRGAQKWVWLKATWRCCEPTCLSLQTLFDLNSRDQWPWPAWPFTLKTVTFDLEVTCQTHHANPWKTCFWPWPLTGFPLHSQSQKTMQPPLKTHFLNLVTLTLTFKVDPDIIQIHPNTEFHDPGCNTSRDMNFCPVIFGSVIDGKRRIWAHRA